MESGARLGFPVALGFACAASYGKRPRSHKVKPFEVLGSVHYEQGMVQAMAGLLSALGRAGDTSKP